MPPYPDHHTVYECQHCAGPVAVDAPACPRCGSKTPFPQKTVCQKEEIQVSKILRIILGVLALAALLAYLLCPGCRGVGITF